MFSGFFKRTSGWQAVCVWLLIGAVSCIALGLISRFYNPRTRPIKEMPLAFWAWQNASPKPDDVRAATQSLNAHILFMRAGQIDFEKARLQRLRAVTGSLPQGVDLHLVYNATRALLAEFEHVQLEELAVVIAAAFQQDCGRALNDRATVVGLQLDFDVPTRLLARYGKLIRVLRQQLKSNAQVSITGLPTWMGSSDLAQVLGEVSYWIPQCYGAMIPPRLDVLAPIASPSAVAEWVKRAAKLKHPFYAGLAAYGYAIHYSRDGQLIEVRGDLDPEKVANHSRLELVERRLFDTHRKASPWRYVYRGVADTVVDGLMIRAGESIMLEVPTVEALRECAQVAREAGREYMLGLCLFRLPGEPDKTNLSLPEIACAFGDSPPTPQLDIQITSLNQSSEHPSQLKLTIINTGTAATLLGEAAMVIDLQLPENRLRAVKADEQISTESFFDLQPCAERRANRLRLQARCFPVGARAQVILEIEGGMPDSLKTSVSMQTGDHREWRDQRVIAVKREVMP